MSINSNYNNSIGNGYVGNLAATYAADAVNKSSRTSKNDGVRFQVETQGVKLELNIANLEASNMTSEEIDANLRSFGTKMTQLFGAYRGKPILFDIYALMNLMQVMAQKLRDGFRELRNAENQAIQSQIRGQAEIQRYAARVAMISGAVLCAVQVGISIVTTAMTVKGLSNQLAKLKQNGVNVMSDQSKLANSLGDAKVVDKAVDNVKATYGEKTFDEVKMTQENQNNYSSQKTAYETIKDKPAELSELKQLSDKVDKGEQLSSDDTKRMEALKAKYPETQKPTENDIQAAQTEVNQKLTEYTTAKSNEAQRVLKANADEVSVAANEYKNARQLANEDMAQNKGKMSDSVKSNLEKAEAKFIISRAKQVSNAQSFIKAGSVNKETTINSIKLNASELSVEANNNALTSGENLMMNRSQAYLQMVSGINMALGQAGQQIIASVKELIAAAATELQADQKMQEDQLDQVKDLFSQELAVIQKVFQLFEAITQKESSTIENIIMA